MDSKLTVIMPAYNEEDAIASAVRDVQQHVLDAVSGSGLVVVNDGSRDSTGTILDQLSAADSRVRVIHQPNGGHGPALRAGLDAATGEYVFLIDSDRQIPLDAFASLWQIAQGKDGAFGVRVKRHDPKLRLALTKLVRRALQLFFGVTLRDANIPFKILRRSIWAEARELIPPDTLAPSLFLAVYVRKRGFDVPECEVPHRERSTGVVSIRRWRLFKFCASAFRQLLSFRRKLAG